MRRVFIAFGVIVFLLYCWASVAYQNQVDVPGYKPVEIDLLGGKSREAWDKDQQGQFQRLMDLETRNYQLLTDSGDDAGKPLGSDDFAAYIAAHSGAPVLMKLRDSSAIAELLSHNYLLRDSIANPDDPDGAPLYVGGRPVEKAMIDDLHLRGVHIITVSGHAAPVNFQVGTSLMIALIFFALVAALKPILWDPFLAMLEKRRRELETGTEAERQNQQEAVRFEDEKRKRHAELDREIQGMRLRGQRDTTHAANAIVRDARTRERDVKLAGLREIGRRAGVARMEMEKRVPELAEDVASALTPGRGGVRWERLEGDNRDS